MKMKEISGKTTICGVIGDPVEHTMSPAMHNAAYRTLGLDFVYLPFHVRPRDLPQAISGMKALNIRGLNVTIPHKTSVIALIDKVDELAAKIGAVNTIANDKGKLIGYNTDAQGFMEALNQHDVDPADKKVLLLGAGGAARAIAFILVETQAEITILNRKQEIDWAYDIVKNIKAHYSVNLKVDELTDANLKCHQRRHVS
jgi:shikimate dehydrogenase